MRPLCLCFQNNVDHFCGRPLAQTSTKAWPFSSFPKALTEMSLVMLERFIPLCLLLSNLPLFIPSCLVFQSVLQLINK